MPRQQAFGEMLQAIDDEITAVERDPAHSFEVREGRRLHRGVGGSLYTFRAELTIPLAPETPVRLIAGEGRFRGVLVAVDDFDVLVHLREDAGESLTSATIATEPAFILQALRDRLTSAADEGRAGLPEAGIAGALTGATPVDGGADAQRAEEGAAALEHLGDPSLNPNPAQLRAMTRVAGSNLHFVWGPPGTGKTANLAQIARMLVESGERVLVLAHANVAVDVAMLRIADVFRDSAALADGRIVRVGPPHHPDALAREEILLDGILARRAPELALERTQLEARRRSLAAALRASTDDVARDGFSADLRRVRERLTTLREELKAQADGVVREASVVGTTLSRFAITELLWELRPDAILLDEASMVSFPWVLAAATRATKRLVVLGDFRQLPPVYLAKTDVARRWLGRDAFDVARVRERIDAGEADERLTMLDTQYRMAAPLGRAVSELAYGGRLRTEEAAALRAQSLSAFEPWPGESLVLVDTSELGPICRFEAKPHSFSRVNPLHLVLGLSLAGLVDREVALITPYRAQARLLAAGVRDLRFEAATAATTHRFQGSERDFVVFDLVDAPPQDSPSRLTGTDLDLALRLLNVGLSRAKGKAIVLAHRDLVSDRFAPTSPVRRALDLCAENGHVVRPTATDMALAFEPNELEWIDSWERTCERLLADLSAASESILINVPEGFVLPEAAAALIAERAHRGTRVVVAASRELIGKLEHAPGELRLLTRPGFVATIDRHVAYVAGSDPDCAVRVVGRSLVAVLERTLFDGDDVARPSTAGELGEATKALPRQADSHRA